MTILDDTGQHQNLIVPGTRIQVWVQLNKAWTDGFEVADVTPEGYLIRRRSDGHVLAVPVPVGSVRRA